MDLTDTRKRINGIDDEIAKLYGERMDLVKNVAEEKKKIGKVVFDPAREKEVIARVTKEVKPEIRVYAKRVYETMFETSKSYQKRFMDISSPVTEKVKEILSLPRGKFPESATIACQGIAGAYSEAAAERLFELPDITFFKTFDAVFQAVEAGFCEYGVLPIENSSVGSVNAVYDLMKEHKFYIARSIKLRISHSLLVNEGAKIEDVKEVVSHDQAINQCRGFLRNLKDVKITVCDNTAMAARYVAESGRKDIAAISSKECAAAYNLKILDSNIQDADSNYTRFICISKEMKIFPKANKISIMTTLPHTPGSLYNTLGKFAILGLNVAKLESRPLPETNFEFMFYFDFDSDVEDEEVIKLIAEMDNSSEDFTFLGAYNEVI